MGKKLNIELTNEYLNAKHPITIAMSGHAHSMNVSIITPLIGLPFVRNDELPKKGRVEKIEFSIMNFLKHPINDIPYSI